MRAADALLSAAVGAIWGGRKAQLTTFRQLL
jgi:hypothetical protein